MGWRLIGKTIAYGLGAVALYAAVFLNADTVMNYFTRGGWYAALPVGTVFLFSYVHGSFSHNVWEVMGIRGSAKDRAAAADGYAASGSPSAAPSPLRLNV